MFFLLVGPSNFTAVLARSHAMRENEQKKIHLRLSLVHPIFLMEYLLNNVKKNYTENEEELTGNKCILYITVFVGCWLQNTL